MEICHSLNGTNKILTDLQNHKFEIVFLLGQDNLDFDKTIIKVELYRNKMFKNIQSLLYGSRINFCTMKTGKDICKIIKYSNSGEEYYKFPRLIELHEFLFNEQPRNLHNSLVDILVCLRCFYKMRFDEDLIEINETFKQIFNQNTSHMIGPHS